MWYKIGVQFNFLLDVELCIISKTYSTFFQLGCIINSDDLYIFSKKSFLGGADMLQISSVDLKLIFSVTFF